MNTFALILLIATIITGAAFFYDFFKLRPNRKLNKEALLKAKPDADKKELKKLMESSGFLGQLASLFPIILFVFLFRSFFIEPFRIPSGSMMPTLLSGDFIAVTKWSYGIRDPLTNKTLIETGKPERGDVVVFKYPEDTNVDYIKRVVGVPGDEVIYRNKKIYLRKACTAERCDSPVGLEVEEIGTYSEESFGFAENYILFKEKRMELVQKKLHNLISGLATAGLMSQQASNSDLRMLLDNFLNGGEQTNFGAVM